MPTSSAVPDLDHSDASAPSAPNRLPPAVKRLFGFIVPVNLGVYLIIGAIPGVLLPLQVQAIDEVNKAANLAIVTGIGAVAAMVMSPVAGLISDRTRSRFGRRTPWLLIGALISGLSLVGMGFANGLLQLVIAWTAVQLTLNLVISPLSALLPDRVPVAVRGTFSTLAGIGSMLGILGGQVLGASLASNIPAAYLIFPGVMLVIIVLFVIFCKDTPSHEMPREPFSFSLFLKTFWVSPRQHPDFFWGFLSRITLFTGYYLIIGYQLYVLQDYIGLGDKAVSVIPLLGVVNLVAVVISIAVSGPLSDRIGRRKPLVIAGAALMGAAMVLPLVMPTMTGMILFTVVCSLGFGVYVSVDAALMSQLLPSEGTFAKDLGVLNIAATLPQTISPFLGGAIVSTLGYATLFPVGIVLAIVGAVSIVFIKSVR